VIRRESPGTIYMFWRTWRIMGTLAEHDTIRKSIKISAKDCIGHCEANLQKSWFDEECSELVDRRKQAKLQRLHVPIVVNEDNLNNVRREASRHFRNKEREYLKDKFNDLESNSKNNIRDLHRGINTFKKGYQSRNNLVKNEKGDLQVDPHKIVNRWILSFIEYPAVGDIKQTEIQTA
jgi:hypothetical protein